MIATIVFLCTILSAENFEADYKKALSLSLEFYDAQGAGERNESWRRATWRKTSTLNDGSDVEVDLSGGWFDAGDHVKFGLPMSYSASMLNWGYLEYGDGYRLANEEEYFKQNLKFVLDYFLKAYNDNGSDDISDDVFYYQVGDGGADHGFWGPPELMTMARPTFKCDKDSKCTEVTAGTSASLASGYLVFKDSHSTYANTLLAQAKKLYNFAETYQGNNGYTAANGFYRSFSGYWDELAWGAIWLYKATNDESYLQKAKTYVQKSGDAIYWGQNWDNVSNGVYLILAKLGDSGAETKIETHLNYWLSGVTSTPAGLAHLSEWGSLRYASTTAFIAFIYSDFINDMDKKLKYREFGIKQMNYILGNNPTKFSYLIGYGLEFPLNPHHRASHNSTTNNIGLPTQNIYTLNGALVGGPKIASDFDYVDDRDDYYRNEVATDYNAGFTGAIAKMVLLNPTSDEVIEENTTTPTPETEENQTKPTPSDEIGIMSIFRQKIKEWNDGYCEEVAIQNSTSQPQSWEIDLEVSENIYSFKDVNITRIDNNWIAKGLFYNEIVQPNGKIVFSFCAGTEPTEEETDNEQPDSLNTIEEPTVETSENLEIIRVKTSDWDKGFCETVKIYNKGSSSINWNIQIEIQGSIYDLWNANYTQNFMNLTAWGVSWNKTIEANQNSEFGFCANKTIETLIQKEEIEEKVEQTTTDSIDENQGDLEVLRIKQNDWGSGYCEDVIIKNSSSMDKVWEIKLDFEGTIYNSWNTTYKIENNQMTATGVGYNSIVKANNQVSFGFCANR